MVKVRRWKFTVLGAAYMALQGMMYAWTNYSELINADTGWSFSSLSLVFTVWSLGMAVGSLTSGFLMRRYKAKPIIIVAALLIFCGMNVAVFIDGNIAPFYIFFGVFGGVGMGMLAVPIFNSVLAWFPDKVGLVSGIMMMGLGVGTLLLGAGASVLAAAIGWRMFFRLYALVVLAVLLVCAFAIKKPAPGQVPEAVVLSEEKKTSGFGKDYTTGQMLKRVSFWIFFFWASFGYMSNVIVSAHANQMAQQLNASTGLANMSVGIHHVFCAIGSVVLGGIYDKLGHKKTMLCMNVLLVGGAACFIGASAAQALPLYVAGLIILGVATGGIPSVCSAHIMNFYGKKFYPSNYAIIGQRVLIGSLGSYLAAAIYEASGGYAAVYLTLTAVLVVFFILSSTIRKP